MKIEKIDLKYKWKDSMTSELVTKINEIIEAINGEEPRVLVCPYCGSDDQWSSSSLSTLMGGPINYYSYHCKKCGESTRVRRVKGETDRRIYLGLEDEIA